MVNLHQISSDDNARWLLRSLISSHWYSSRFAIFLETAIGENLIAHTKRQDGLTKKRLAHIDQLR